MLSRVNMPLGYQRCGQGFHRRPAAVRRKVHGTEDENVFDQTALELLSGIGSLGVRKKMRVSPELCQLESIESRYAGTTRLLPGALVLENTALLNV
uniref:Uncharacterized protein n=1 Tax=Vespula pensylvanica TaxID=30213 RepID=A0A834NFA2_VESPE|nr:hypothetical protein H0235_014491 [Vespula pensylvanica]